MNACAHRLSEAITAGRRRNQWVERFRGSEPMCSERLRYPVADVCASLVNHVGLYRKIAFYSVAIRVLRIAFHDDPAAIDNDKPVCHR